MSTLLARLLTAGARNKAEHHARVSASAASLGLADPYGGAS